MTLISKNRKIEIEKEWLRIRSRSGEVEEEINLKEMDEIVIKNNYKMPEETLKEMYREAKGDPLTNYLVLKKGNESTKFEFLIDSYYMIEQMKKNVNYWRSEGYQLNKTDERKLLS